MPNHYHFLIRQNTDLPISNLMSRLCSSYVKYFNAKYSLVGSLFQDTFKAKVILPDNYLAYLTAYIHNNPKDPLTYPYSSYREYTTGNRHLISGEDIVLKMFDNNLSKYEKFMIDNQKEVGKDDLW
jgi:putative transposase